MEGMCYRRLLAVVCVDESDHYALVHAGEGKVVVKEFGEEERMSLFNVRPAKFAGRNDCTNPAQLIRANDIAALPVRNLFQHPPIPARFQRTHLPHVSSRTRRSRPRDCRTKPCDGARAIRRQGILQR